MSGSNATAYQQALAYQAALAQQAMAGQSSEGPGMAAPQGHGSGWGGSTPFGRVPGGSSRMPIQSGGPLASMQPGVPGSGAQQPTINPVTGFQQFNLQDAAMSGSMPQLPAQGPSAPQMPPSAPPMGGQAMGGQQGGAPQLPPQVLAMLMQRMQAGGMQGAPGGAPSGPPGMPPGMPPQAGQGNPFGPQAGMPPQSMQGQQPGVPPRLPPPGSQQQGGPAMTPQQMAAQGRNGDSIVAHLTPGEIEIPPQVQTPQLIAAIQQAFARFGISPAQFTAGSPVSSHNPATTAPEYNLLSAILPVIGAGVGSIVPGVGTAVGAGIGGAIGGGAGQALSGGNAGQIAMGAVGGGAGGALGGGILGGAGGGAGGGVAGGAGGGAAGGATSAAVPSADALLSAPESSGGVGGAMFTGPNGLSSGLTPGAVPAASGGALPAASVGSGITPGGIGGALMQAARPAAYAGIGSTVGGMLAPSSQKSNLPPGFNNPLPPLNTNFGQLNGSGVQSTPTFQGYNPYAAVSGPNPGYTFYQKAT